MRYTQAARDAATLFRRNRLHLVQVHDPDDLISLVAACSPESRYLRFHTGMAHLRPTAAAQLAVADGYALGLRTWDGDLVADARYIVTGDGEAELAILVADAHQGKGLGRALLAVLLEAAAGAGITTLTGYVLGSNDTIMGLLQSLAPMEVVESSEGSHQVRISLEEVAAAA